MKKEIKEGNGGMTINEIIVTQRKLERLVPDKTTAGGYSDMIVNTMRSKKKSWNLATDKITGFGNGKTTIYMMSWL